VKLFSTRWSESRRAAAIDVRLPKAFVLPGPIGLASVNSPSAIPPGNGLAQSLEAGVARRSGFEVGKNLHQSDSRGWPVVYALFRHPARVTDRPLYDVSYRNAHSASHVLSGAPAQASQGRRRRRHASFVPI
jgi:hypothetical protein